MTAAVLGNTDGFCFPNATPPTPSPNVSRYLLHETARRILHDQRLARCSRVVSQPGGSVRIAVADGRASYRGLVFCANPWACPVCAYRISQTRAEDLQRGIDAALAYGHGVTLVTHTFSHGVADRLDELLPKLAESLRRAKSGRAAVALKKRFGIIGEVRALEVTHGKNGWHPHTHTILITQTPLTGHALTQLKRSLFVLWRRGCAKSGLDLPGYRHGIDVKPAKYAAEYVAKWGFAAELTRGHLKKGHVSGRTPWQLLSDARDGDTRASWLFREFAMSFKGRAQLRWSKGLREYLGVGEELTDQTILALDEETPAVEHVIDLDDWRIVRKFSLRGALLDAALEGVEKLTEFIDAARARARREFDSDGRTNRLDFVEPFINVEEHEERIYEPGT